MTLRRTALVTGGNRGIGLEICRQLAAQGLSVVLTGRDAASVRTATYDLTAEGLSVTPEIMDIGNELSVLDCAERLHGQGVAVDVLINNAAIFTGGNLLSLSTRQMDEAFRVNFFGAFWTCRAFVPGMIERGYGRVVNLTSGGGQISEGLPGPAAYGLSKVALNALTVKLAQEATGDVKVNAACPGWVRTRMGGDKAPKSPGEGADTVVWLATIGEDGPNGGLFRDRRRVDW
ncbi:MAG: SDR family NAD(P)-dependent oxidoreductase [Leptospirillia bacterium]